MSCAGSGQVRRVLHDALGEMVALAKLNPGENFREIALHHVDAGDTDLSVYRAKDSVYESKRVDLAFTTSRDRLRSGGYGPAMKRLPPGEFCMGVERPEEEGKWSSEAFWLAPRQQVPMATGFDIGVYPVTFEE